MGSMRDWTRIIECRRRSWSWKEIERSVRSDEDQSERQYHSRLLSRTITRIRGRRSGDIDMKNFLPFFDRFRIHSVSAQVNTKIRQSITRKSSRTRSDLSTSFTRFGEHIFPSTLSSFITSTLRRAHYAKSIIEYSTTRTDRPTTPNRISRRYLDFSRIPARRRGAIL